MNTDLRLALPAAAGWIALATLVGAPGLLGPTAVALFAGSGAAVCVALLTHRQRLRTAASIATLLTATTALLLSSAAIAAPIRTPDRLTAAARTHRTVTATAVTDDVFHTGDSRAPLPVTLTSVTIGRERFNARVPALLFGPPDAPSGCGIGTVLRLSGTVAAAEPGGAVAFLVFARGSPTVQAQPPWYLAWANTLRSRFLAGAAGLPGDGGDLLPGLAIGDTSAVGASLDADMKSTSLSHLTAVSGANCAVLIGLVMLAGRALGIARRWRIAAALVVLVGFVALVTPQASVLRSALMAGLVLLALAGGRRLRGVPVLSLAVVILLTADPWLSRDYGFVLSVLATAGLLLLARPLTRLLARWLPTALAAVIAIPLAAQLACQPVLILLNPTIPLYGVIANLLSEPAAPAATVLGLIGCVLIGISAPLGHAVCAIAWIPSAWIAAVARFFAGLPGAQLPWLPGAVGVALVAVAVAVALFAALGEHRRGLRRGIAAGLVLILTGYGAVLAGNQIVRQASMPHDWQIAACDIGQGDAVLVRSAGQTALIDTGPDPVLLQHCLRQLGIDRIQLLVLTHYDLDHVGGTAAVFGRADRALVGPVADAHDTRLRERLVAAGTPVEQVAQGLTGTLGDLAWQVLWPPRRLGGVLPGNDASVTVAFAAADACPAGCLSSIFLGDLGNEPQARVLAANRIPVVDVVKVAHHGSADQNEKMYRQLHARVGLISVGADNDYGHPTATLLHILASVGTTAERTDRQGMILVAPGRDGAVRVWSERPPR